MSDRYDPNCEATNAEKVVAGRWECLRRNKDFLVLSAHWLRSEKFRQNHALSPNYHNMQHHTPRCALDWMLTAAQRVCLAEFQIEKFHWFLDGKFNFGPIICRENFSAVFASRKNWRDFLKVEPLPNPPKPITVEDSWDCTSELFRNQFRLAYSSAHEFGEVNARLNEHFLALRLAAHKLAAGDPLKETPIIARYLFELGNELRELAEFSKVFKIPKRRYSEKQFRHFLDKMRNSFETSNLLVPTKTYDTHKSYQGTTEDWRWFLEAERLGLDIRKSADAYRLAELYSEDMRQRAMRGNAPRRAKAHGHTGAKFSSKTIKNRRSAVKRHVLAIQEWILAAYPPPEIEASATAS